MAPFKRKYASSSADSIEKAICAVHRGTSLRAAAKEHGVNRQTLKNKISNQHRGSYGRPTAVDADFEAYIAKRFVLLCDWGFPVTSDVLKFIVKDYLDASRITISCFRDNIPGSKWIRNFIRRNGLSRRNVSNIARRRAAVDRTIITDYFNELKRTVENVPAENIVNYDETALVDDSGKRKCIVKRGTKYPEAVANHAKSGISVMFAGSANGDLLPPYIVYKSKNLYKQWTVGGPDGAKYTFTKSGWFDDLCFADWFRSVCLPYLRRKTGPKILIGDNLSSHINKEVIDLCLHHDIRFVCLPPNSSHITQPLDVAFFSSLKRIWRSIVSDWRLTNEGQKHVVMPKSSFPSKLRELYKRLNLENLKSGFSACGIFPFNPEAVLKRLPQVLEPSESQNKFDDVIVNHLQQLRHGQSVDCSGPSRVRRTKLNVVSGRAIGDDDLDFEGNLGPSDELNVNREQSIDDHDDESQSEPQIHQGDFILVKLAVDGRSIHKHFVAQVLQVCQNDIEVSFLKRVSETSYVFPEKEDRSSISTNEIVETVYATPDRRGLVWTIDRDLDQK